MSVPTITLTGDGATGLLPMAAEYPTLLAAVAALPRTVKLGRKPPTVRARTAPRLAAYLDPLRTVPPPPKVDWFTKAQASIGRMFLNDRFGDCVIAGKYHAVGAWTGNDSDSGGVAVGSDQEVYQTYQNWCGPGDNGCVITNVLDRMQAQGIPMNGVRHTIDGYVAVDWTDKLEVQVALVLFGALTIGVNLPSAWESSAVWDVTGSPIVGGHDVTCVGYDEQGVQVSSWGRVYTITWAAFLQRRWVEECYALLGPDWYGKDGKAPGGLDVATLKADLAQLGGGTIPPLPDPGPVGPPPPPAPQTITLTGQTAPQTITFQTGVYPFHQTQTVTIPGQPISVSGPLPARAAAGFSFDLVLALLKLSRDVYRSGHQVLIADLQAVVDAVAARSGILAAIERLATDLMAAGSDPAIVADLLRIAADLGIEIPAGSVLRLA